MATKSDKCSFIEQSFATSENRYYNLNLNQSQKCATLIPVQFNSKPKYDKYCGTAATDFKESILESDNYKEKEKSQLWNKSSKVSTFTTLNEDSNDLKKQWKYENALNTTNKSTLSLHIAAYKNSIEASDLFVNENNEGLKKEKFKLINTSKQGFFNALKSQNPFEFPRQQDGDQRNKPELMQFETSQQLTGSNRASSANEGFSISTMASAEDSKAITCTNLLTALGDQLQAQMDINSDYQLFQKKIERQKNYATKLLKDVSKRTEEVEKKWNDFLDETVGVRNQMVKNLQKKNSKFAHGLNVEPNKAEDLSEIRQKNEDILQLVASVKELTESLDSYSAKIGFDQRRLSEIEEKNKAVQKLVKTITIILKRENENAKNIRLLSENEEKVYGVWELTSGYKQLLRYLGITLENLATIQEQSDKTTTPIPPEELNLLIIMLKRLDETITAEISSNKNSSNVEQK